ncbi:glycerophosphodiester phosphodiesterase [Streptomyces winkii]|uniref:glycerophosphodiester phosphodiesterase n=1 Tax=Streptomyces winkii TaxID=3051178 RepID=UPI0028D13258|nr:glycerophosphodiester phosphodiesterase family protein [Streptomyces sp. DSM 40971]
MSRRHRDEGTGRRTVLTAGAGGIAALIGLSAFGSRDASGAPAAPAVKQAAKPLIIAHRGLSDIWPQHTMQAYKAARAVGDDIVVEADVFASSDGVLFCRHDELLADSTDVRERFPAQAEAKVWELKAAQLEQLTGTGGDPALQDGPEPSPEDLRVPRFARFLDYAVAEGVRVYVETKHAQAVAPLKRLLAEKLSRTTPDLYVESFVAQHLRDIGFSELRNRTRLMQEIPDDAALREIAGYASVFAPAAKTATRSTVARIHAAGLEVHVHGLEEAGLPESDRDSYTALLNAGVDGIFTDRCDVGKRALDGWLADER